MTSEGEVVFLLVAVLFVCFAVAAWVNSDRYITMHTKGSEVMDTNKLENIIAGYRINADDAAWLRALAPPASVVPADAWVKLYRRAVDVANGLTNYVEDRPELRDAERKLDAIERDARAILAAQAKGVES